MNESPNEQVTLKILRTIEALRNVAPRDPQAAARGREHFLAQARQMRPAAAGVPEEHLAERSPVENPTLAGKKKNAPFTPLSVLLLAGILLFGAAGGTAYAAQQDLPGDALYALKLFTEEARLWLAADEQDIYLYQEFADRRVKEVGALANRGRYADMATALRRYQSHIKQATQAIQRRAQQDAVEGELLGSQLRQKISLQIQELERVRTHMAAGQSGPLDETIRWGQPGEKVKFEGNVEVTGPQTWEIGGRTITIQAITWIEEGIQVGDHVQIEGVKNAEGSLLAHRIWLLDAGDETGNGHPF